MTTHYKCSTCGTKYDTITQDGFCPKGDCYGIGLLELYEESSNSAEDTTLIAADAIGLCVLVCDASGSMERPAFAGNPATRVRLVANAAAAGISDFYTQVASTSETGFSKPEQAYIAIISFGETAAFISDKNGNPFIKTVAQIQQECPKKEDLADFLLHALTDGCSISRSYTDITKALVLAKEIQDAARQGNLSKFGISGTFELIEHDVIEKNTNRFLSVPNTRVLIYSDGGHNAIDGTPLNNPFASDSLSTLLTVFFGNPDSSDPTEKRGADEMKSMACICPIHGLAGYFLIDSPQRYTKLRGLFRMASGASGFCPGCLAQSQPKEK